MSEFSDWSENERYGACGDAERTNREGNASESRKASLQEHEHGARQSKSERGDKAFLKTKSLPSCATRLEVIPKIRATTQN